MPCPNCGNARWCVEPGQLFADGTRGPSLWKCAGRDQYVPAYTTGGPGLTNPFAGPGVIHHPAGFVPRPCVPHWAHLEQLDGNERRQHELLIEELEERRAAAAPWAKHYEAQRDALVARLEETPDPHERLVFAVAHTCDIENSLHDAHAHCRAPEVLSAVFPEWWRTPDTVAASFGWRKPPWSSGDLAEWFADRALAAGVPFNPTGAHSGLWWTPRRGTPRKGWLLPSTEYLTLPAYREKPGRRVSTFIERNGQRWRRDLDGTASTRVLRANSLAPGGELHVTALARMAELLRMKEPDLEVERPPADWQQAGG